MECIEAKEIKSAQKLARDFYLCNRSYQDEHDSTKRKEYLLTSIGHIGEKSMTHERKEEICYVECFGAFLGYVLFSPW